MRKSSVALLAIWILSCGSAAMAASLDVVPSLSVEQMYDSNVFNTDGDEKGDFFLRATPGLALTLRALETSISLRSSVYADTYYKYTEQSSASSAVQLSLDMSSPLAVTPRLSITPNVHFVQAQDSYRRTQLITTGDAQDSASITTETGVQKSRDYGGGLRMSYLVTPNLAWSAGGGFKKREFLDNTSGGVDSRVFYGDTSVSYRFTPNFSTGVFASTSYNDFASDNNSRTYAGGLTASYQASPGWLLEGRAGASRAQQTETAVGEDVFWSPYLSLSFGYTAKEFRAGIRGSVSQSGGGSLGYTTETKSVGINIGGDFSQRWGWDATGTFQENKPLDQASSEKSETATGTAGLRYRPREWAKIQLSGSALRQWAGGSTGTDLNRYTGMLGITIGYTYNLF